MEIINDLIYNYPYFVSIVLFSVGCFIILAESNLIKKIIGINIMETSVFLFFIALGNIKGHSPPVISPYLTKEAAAEQLYINPLPSALVLTGIVVSLSITAFALVIVAKIYKYYGTIDSHEIFEIRSRKKW